MVALLPRHGGLQLERTMTKRRSFIVHLDAGYLYIIRKHEIQTQK